MSGKCYRFILNLDEDLYQKGSLPRCSPLHPMGNCQQLMSCYFHQLLLMSSVRPISIKISCTLPWEESCPGGDQVVLNEMGLLQSLDMEGK